MPACGVRWRIPPLENANCRDLSHSTEIIPVDGRALDAAKTSLGSPAEKTSRKGKTLMGKEGLTT